MLEGFAFLAARVHLKIDDEFPEITEALLSILYPHYIRPIPSMSIVQMHLGAEQAKRRRASRPHGHGAVLEAGRRRAVQVSNLLRDDALAGARVGGRVEDAGPAHAADQSAGCRRGALRLETANAIPMSS